MQYNHMWGRPVTLPLHVFCAVVDDFRRLLAPLADHDAHVGLSEERDPRLDDDVIAFNGVSPCQHGRRLRRVTDVGRLLAVRSPPPLDGRVENRLQAFRRRECRGCCPLQPFVLERELAQADLADGRASVWRWCRTDRRPYDLAVMCVLIVAREHFGPSFLVDSNGDEPQWLEARLLCERVLGYGLQTLLWHGD